MQPPFFNPINTMSAVTLQQAKDYLRIDFDEDDTLIQGLIDAAEDWVSKYTNHVLSPTTKVYESGCYEVFDYPFVLTGGSCVNTHATSTSFTVPSGETATAQVGYATANDIPPVLLLAVKKLVVYMYENRDVYQSGMPNDVQLLINRYRRFIAVY